MLASHAPKTMFHKVLEYLDHTDPILDKWVIGVIFTNIAMVLTLGYFINYALIITSALVLISRLAREATHWYKVYKDWYKLYTIVRRRKITRKQNNDVTKRATDNG